MKKIAAVLFFLLLSAALLGCTSQTAATPTVEPTTAQTEVTAPPAIETPPAATAPALEPTAVSGTPETMPPASTDSPAVSDQPASAVIPPTGSEAEACINKAGFFGDVTIPDNTPFTQGVEFVKTWKVRNEGTCAWGEGYAVAFAYGEQMDAPLTAPLPAAEPGDVIEVSVPMVSPRRDGVFTGNYQFQDAQGTRFGLNSAGQDYMWVMISVGTKMDAQPVPVPVTGACDVSPNADYVNQLLGMINQARAEDGQTALTLSSTLTAAAQDHSRDMACHSLLSHVGTDGSSWRERIAGKGYNAAAASENIYAGDPQYGGDAAGAMTWWLNSQVHRDNILSGKVTEIGIGYAYVSSSEYGGYFTLNFGRPK